MARSRFFPLDDLTHGEWLYLEARDPRRAEEFSERRDRFRDVIKRLVRQGRNAEQLHRAWMAGINVWVKHRVHQHDETRGRPPHGGCGTRLQGFNGPSQVSAPSRRRAFRPSTMTPSSSCANSC